MDARQYLAQKGLDGKPTSRPQLTLEEKSWARARESGEHRPRAGTPHDWEDWERYHEQLAEGAEQLEQKIDPDGKVETEENALETDREPSVSQSKVQHYSPEQDDAALRTSVDKLALEPFAAYVALGVLLPPLAVWLSDGGTKRGVVALVLTLLGWLPGAAYALYWIARQRDRN
ncbi:MAG: YqaE/Pmp3 family membrane protein [Halomonas sp.]|uniref:YqaE/Pmp3 family membrane protein n=1 Tax=Halomonas sp. TaxID=1486246 RepID=UPI003F91B00C